MTTSNCRFFKFEVGEPGHAPAPSRRKLGRMNDSSAQLIRALPHEGRERLQEGGTRYVQESSAGVPAAVSSRRRRRSAAAAAAADDDDRRRRRRRRRGPSLIKLACLCAAKKTGSFRVRSFLQNSMECGCAYAARSRLSTRVEQRQTGLSRASASRKCSGASR